MGPLGDDRAVSTLREWIAIGKPIDTRRAAISSLARLKKDDKEITQQIAGLLNDAHFQLRFGAIFALGERGDVSAVPSLESLLKSNDLSIEMVPMIRAQIARLKRGPGKTPEAGESNAAGEAGGDEAVATRLDRLEKMMQEMNQRLKNIEESLPKH
jgi:HEAT repeat protein